MPLLATKPWRTCTGPPHGPRGHRPDPAPEHQRQERGNCRPTHHSTRAPGDPMLAPKKNQDGLEVQPTAPSWPRSHLALTPACESTGGTATAPRSCCPGFHLHGAPRTSGTTATASFRESPSTVPCPSQDPSALLPLVPTCQMGPPPMAMTVMVLRVMTTVLVTVVTMSLQFTENLP